MNLNNTEIFDRIETIADLMEILQEVSKASPDGEDTALAAAFQPNYPLVGRFTCARLLRGKDGKVRLWIALDQSEADGSPYAPPAVWSDDEDSDLCDEI